MPVATTPAEKGSPLKTLWVKVTDPDGKPVGGGSGETGGSTVRNAHGTWPQELAGEPKLTVTDDDGRTSVDYPPSIGGEAVTTVSLFVDHPDFCVRNVDVSVAGTKESPAPVALEGERSCVSRQLKPAPSNRSSIRTFSF